MRGLFCSRIMCLEFSVFQGVVGGGHGCPIEEVLQRLANHSSVSIIHEIVLKGIRTTLFVTVINVIDVVWTLTSKFYYFYS